MKRANIVEELNKRGYIAQATETVKNSVVMKGIVIRGDSPIAPVIYTDELIRKAENNGDMVENVADEIIRIYSKHRQQNFDIDRLYDRDFIFEHVVIGLQRESDENLVKKPSGYDGIESYLYMQWGEGFSVKIKADLLKIAGISQKEAWQRAEQNVCKESKLTTLGNILGSVGLMGETQMYVITNKKGIRGASAILNRRLIEEVANGCGVTKLVMFPSSVHEMLLIPYDVSMNIEELNEMVASINSSVVEPEDRLTDRAYIIEL